MRAKWAGKIWNWTVASKDVIIKCERSEPEIFFQNWTVASEASGNFLENFALFPPNSSKLRSAYLFSFKKRTHYLFPAFSKSEYLFPKSASPPPPSESNGCPLMIVLIRYSILLARGSGKTISSRRVWLTFYPPRFHESKWTFPF